MKSAVNLYFERLFAPLFRCSDCDGRGMRWHAMWPRERHKVEMFQAGSEPTVTSGVEKTWKKCETCRGTGRA